MPKSQSKVSKENSVFENRQPEDLNTGKELRPKDVDESLGEAIEETMDEEMESPENDPARERSR